MSTRPNPIVMHCNYAEQGQTLHEMCALAVSCGYDGIQFRRRPSGFEGTPQSYLDNVAAAVEKHRIKTVIFSAGPNLMSADANTRQREIELAADFCRLAVKRFGTTIFNADTGSLLDPQIPYTEYDRQGSALARDEHWEWAAAGFKILGDLGQELGCRFAFETHMCYLHDLPAAAKKLCDLIDRESVGINLDYANIVCFPEPPSLEQAVAQCGRRLYYAHLKNCFKLSVLKYDNTIRCGLGEGLVNNREFLRRLKALNYTGPICIEAPRPGDREWFARQDIAYLRQVLTEIGWN